MLRAGLQSGESGSPDLWTRPLPHIVPTSQLNVEQVFRRREYLRRHEAMRELRPCLIHLR